MAGLEEQEEQEGLEGKDEPTTNELKEQLQAEKQRTEKISQDYQTVRQQRDQFESAFGRIGKELETSGKGRLVVGDDKVKIEFNDPKPINISEIDNELTDLSAKMENGDISTTDYTRKAARLEAKRLYIEESASKEAETKKSMELKQHDDNMAMWAKKINDDFAGQANDTKSELFKEMSEMALPKVDYQKDIAAYYELARSAKMSMKAKKLERGEYDASADFQNITNSGQYSSGTSENSQAMDSFYGSRERTHIEATLGKEAATRLRATLEKNYKAGNISKNDPYLMNSTIHMTS